MSADSDTPISSPQSEAQAASKRRPRDTLGTITWAVILIWAGIVLLSETTGVLGRYTAGLARGWPVSIPFLSSGTWTIIAAGVGIILVIEAVIQILVPSTRSGIIGPLVMAAVMFGLAFGNWGVVWPLILVVLGAGMIAGAVSRHSRDE